MLLYNLFKLLNLNIFYRRNFYSFKALLSASPFGGISYSPITPYEKVSHLKNIFSLPNKGSFNTFIIKIITMCVQTDLITSWTKFQVQKRLVKFPLPNTASRDGIRYSSPLHYIFFFFFYRGKGKGGHGRGEKGGEIT